VWNYYEESNQVGLTSTQVEQLRNQGFLVAPGLIDAFTLKAIRGELHGIVSYLADQLYAEGIIPDAYSSTSFDKQLANIALDNPEAAKVLIKRMHGNVGGGFHMGPAMFDLMTHPRLLEAVASIVGPEIIGTSVFRIRPKAPGLDSGEVPWHQDSGYFMRHCDRELIITCWIPLIDANEENGCLHVIPQAHNLGIFEHRTGGPGNYLIIPEKDLPAGHQPRSVPVEKGDVLFLTNLTPHASFQNRSDQMRWSIDLRYQSQDAPNNVEMHQVETNSDGPEVAIACYPPEADFVLRSPNNPEQEIRNWEKLKRIRDDHFRTSGRAKGDVQSRWSPVEKQVL
jgi:phytanoyl-CoA hydroxylase